MLLKIIKALVSAGALAYLINCSFSSGVIPDKLKIARVIPVYKRGLKSTVINYRPILYYQFLIKFLRN